jgi:hypothetical protein
MSWDSDLDELTVHTVTISPQTGLNGDGEHTYGASATYSAFIEHDVRMVRDAQGVERVSNTLIIISATSAFTPKDEMVLPAAFTPQVPVIITVERLSDEDGLHHTEFRV